jgi:hypothetical protein
MKYNNVIPVIPVDKKSDNAKKFDNKNNNYFFNYIMQ